MQYHKTITNVDSLRQFITWLPELEPNERYYLCLQVRKKYLPSLKTSDALHLRRFVSTKDDLLVKIMQLECPIGSYITKDGVVIPDEAMVLYIMPNPRDMHKATFAIARAMVDLLQKQSQNPSMIINPHSEALTQIHKSKSRSVFVHFDIDRPSGVDDVNSPKSCLTVSQVFDIVADVVGVAAITIIETRGGMHVLIDPKKVQGDHKNWYPIICKSLQVDQTGDLLVPVIGCNQGGFTPRFYVR